MPGSPRCIYMHMPTLTTQDIALLNSLPASERQKLLTHISRTDERLAASIASQLDADPFTAGDSASVASFFDVSEKTIEVWKRKGMPYIKGGKGVRGHYDLREIAQWVAAQRSGISLDDADKLQVDAAYRDEKRRIAALQRQQLEGTLVDVAEYNERLMATLAMIRQGVEQFRRTYGSDAVEMLAGIVDEIEGRLLGGD